jgi:hypothetical protein
VSSATSHTKSASGPEWLDKLRSEIEARMAMYSADVAAAMAHRACCGTEHDPPNGKLHGCCVVCGVPWPCETASYFLRSKSDEQQLTSGSQS